MNRREQRIGIFWEFRLREKTADARRVFFIRLLLNKRCECDGRSKSRIKLNANMSVDADFRHASRSMAIV